MNKKIKKRLDAFLKDVLQVSLKHRLKIESYGNEFTPYVEDIDTGEGLCSSATIIDDRYTYMEADALPIELDPDQPYYSVGLNDKKEDKQKCIG